MKTKLKRFSKRSLAMLLSLLMMLSVLSVGSIITTAAADTITLYYQKDMPSGNYSASSSIAMTQSAKNTSKYYVSVSLQNGSYGFYVKWGNDYYKVSATATTDRDVLLYNYGSTNYGNSNHRVTYSTGAATTFTFTFDTSNNKICVRPRASTTVKIAWSTASGHDGDWNLGTYDTMTHTSNGLYTKDLTLTAVKHYMFIQTNNNNYYRSSNTLTQNSSASDKVAKMYYYGTDNYGGSGDKVNFTPSAAGKYRFTYDIKDQTVTMYRLYDVTYNKGTAPSGGGAISGTAPSAQLKVHGTNLTLATNAFTSTGYTQSGWATSDGGSQAYTSGASYSTNSGLTLYPYWSENTYSVTVSAGTGGTVSTSSVTAGCATKPSITATANDGYQFSSWSVSGGASVTSSTSATTTVSATAAGTVTANFTKKSYTVKKTETGASTAGTVKVGSTTITTGGVSIEHGSYTVTVTAPTGYNVSAVSGITGTTSGLNTDSVSITGVSITSTTTIAVTYAASGTPSLDSISNQSKTVNDTTFNVSATISDEDKKTGTLSVVLSSGTTAVATVGTATVSGSTVTIPVTVKAPGTSTITATLKDGSTTLNSQTFDVTVAEPTFTLTNKNVYVHYVNQSVSKTTDPTPSSIAWTSSNTEYITITSNTGKVTAVKTPPGTTNQTSTITATATYACGYTKTATCTATLYYPRLQVSATSQSGNIGDTTTAQISALSYPGNGVDSASTYLDAYSWSTSDSTVVSIDDATAASPTLTFKKTGTATISLEVTYKNTGLKKTNTNTLTITVNAPTVSFTDATDASINVGGSVTRTATGSAPTGGTISYSGSNQYIDVNSSTGAVTGLKPTSSAQTVTATYTVTYSGQTSTATATYNVTVKTPSVSASAMTVAVDDSKQLIPSTTNATGVTYTYNSSDPAICTVDGDGWVKGINAGTATVTVTAVCRNWSGTATSAITVEAPSLTIADTANASTKYLTVGTNYTKALSNNFGATSYTVTSSNTSVATASESSGTLTVVPVAKGTSTITVTASKSVTRASTITNTQTFTVNVAEADTYKYFYFTNGVGWSGVKIYMWQDSNTSNKNHEWPGVSMVKIGKNENNQDVYAYRYDASAGYDRLIISDANNEGNRVNIGGVTDLVLGDHNAAWCNTANTNNTSTAANWFNCTIAIPQVTIADATTPLGTNYTLNATKVTEANVGEYRWSSATTSVATVTADTNTTASTTVVPVDAGTSVITVKAYAVAPTNWTLDYSSADALPYIGSTDTATITVTADDRTVTYSTKASYDHSDYDSHDGVGGTINTSPNVTSGNTVSHGTTVTFTASASAGYKHVGWRVGTGSNEFTTSAKEIRITSDTTVYALFDKVYTTTISKGANGTVKKSDGTTDFTGEDVVWNNTPATMKVTPSAGYMIDYANCTNLSKFYTVDTSATTGTVTITGKTVAEADKANTTITIAFKAITPVINYTAKKTDDGSTLTNGGGTITAKEIHYTAATSGSGTASYWYLWWSGSDNPEQHSNKADAVKGTDNCYYASFQPSGNFFFNMTDSSTSATAGTQKFNSSTTADVDSTAFANWTTVGNWGTWYIGKGYLNSGDTVYIKYDPSANKVYFRNSAFTYTIAYSGGSGGTPASETEVKTLSASGDTITYNNRVYFTANANTDYKFEGWYSDASCTTLLSTDRTYKTTDITAASYSIYAKFKKMSFITLYNSYMYNNGSWTFVASPPRRVEIGDGSTKRTYVYDTGAGNQRGEEYVLSDSGTYYEGNKLVVYPGEKIKLTFSTLASSDAIKGVFFNNNRRYTTEQEDNNLYYLREYKAGGWGDREHGYNGGLTGEGESVPDDDWDYTFNADTTIYADEGYYTDEAETILVQKANYAANKTGGDVDQVDHTVEWIAEGSYLNIDIQLDYKYQFHINGDDWSGLKIENMNDEGYYYRGEDFDSNFKISIEQPTDGSGTYSFTDTNVVYVDKDGNPVSQPTGMAVVAKQSGGSNATSASNVSYFLVTGEMPGQNVYIQLPITKKYKLKLANIVVSDSGSNARTMLTECSSNSSSATNSIGTITAVPKKDNVTGSDISDDGTYYTYDGNNNSGHVEVYTDGSSSNKYLNGGVNKGGSMVEDGSTVTYTFNFNSGKDAEYTFVGWFEGKLVGGTDYKFEPDYNKKLSGKTSFTYTPKKDTVVIAVGTRDIYLGGNFTSDGAYTTTSASQTWNGGRILMDFDPTYVNPEDSTKKGRYYYKFESVTPNTEYQFRCYDTAGTGASGQDKTNLSVWSSWSGSDYGQDNNDILFGRHKYDAAYGYSHGAFVYKNNTNSWNLIDNTGDVNSSTKNHQTNGYAAPVEVYFYAYDGGITVNSTYQWSKAYVSAGVGIDVKSVSGGTTTYNTPSVSVASTTVGGATVSGYNTPVAYGQENILECTVKEKDGQIRVTANPNDANLCVQAFLVYNIDTKVSEAVIVNSEEATGAITANITVPQNSKLYIVPIYKFTQTWIDSQNALEDESKHIESHTVYVRASDIDKDDWGGLVSMYSWGTTSGYDSGGWPGQLMIPSDDGQSFYAPLTYTHNGLAGVTFNNFTKIWGGNFVNFLGLYQSRGVSDTVYSSYTNTNTHYINQAYDYREPISIIDNINDGGIYDSEDMDLTFALKQGNKTSATIGNGAYNDSFDYEYLSDRSGKKRVDLNGNVLSTNSTATYYVVCRYTEEYKSNGTKTYDFKDGTRDGTSTHNMYSIEWFVYDQEHDLIGSEKLSAAFTDVYKSEMLTYVAKMLDSYGYPVSGKAVKIAYENPKESSSDNTEAKRFSGQWYADGVNSLIEGNVRVGIYSDGAWIPSDTNAPGYATATVGVKSGTGITIPNASTGEQFVQEDGCSGNSLVKVTKKHATDGNITYTVSSTDNFLGWYRDNGEGGFEPVGSNYKNQTITPSFNSDLTLYAFYSASASYRFKYTSRTGNTKYYTAKGTDLTTEELAASGTLNPTTRSADITSKLSGITGIKVFNHDLTYALTSPDTSSPYTITYTAGDTASTYTLTVMAYNSSGTLTTVGSKTGTWNTSLDVNNDLTSYASGFTKGSKLINNKPSDPDTSMFIGWRKYNGSSFEGPILSTKENFGYSITSDTTIAPYFVDPTDNDTINEYISEAWKPGVDNSVVTQELTSSTEGVIYNDNLISFRYGSDTNKRIDGSSIYSNELNTVPEGKQCGVVVLAQANDATDEQKTTFNTQYSADSHVQSSVNYFVTGAGTSKSSVKLSSSKYGDAYAFHVKAETLSNLNRANIVQALDYAKFNSGNYKVMSYYYDGSTIVYSNITSGTLTCS